LFFYDEVVAKSVRISDYLLFSLYIHGKAVPWARGQIRPLTADYGFSGLDFKRLIFFHLKQSSISFSHSRSFCSEIRNLT